MSSDAEILASPDRLGAAGPDPRRWALAGYALAYALVLITGGRLGDTFGRKRLFLTGVVGFTVMSAPRQGTRWARSCLPSC